MAQWLGHPTGVTEVKGSISTLNSENLTISSFICCYANISYVIKARVHSTPFHLSCSTLDLFSSLNRQCYFYTKQVFDVADAFSSGPYTVEILNGNDQDRFEVKDGSYSTVPAPSTPAPDTFILDGETILLCPNATDGPVTPMPTVAPGTVAF